MGFIGCGMCIWGLVILHGENKSLFRIRTSRKGVSDTQSSIESCGTYLYRRAIHFLFTASFSRSGSLVAAAAHLNKSGTRADTASHLTPFTHALHLVELPLSCMWFLGSVGPTENTHREGENKHLIQTCSCLDVWLLLQHLDINKAQLIFKVYTLRLQITVYSFGFKNKMTFQLTDWTELTFRQTHTFRG